MSKDDEPIDAEVIDDGTSSQTSPRRPGALQRIEPAPIAPRGPFSIFRSPTREARKAREWADAVNAHGELKVAQKGFRRVQEELLDIDTILEADQSERDRNLWRVQNEGAEEVRIAKNRALQDELAEEELRAKIAEARRRRIQAEGAGGSDDENARRRAAIDKKFREKMGRRFTEQEVRARAEELKAEIRHRVGGQITPSVQRELDNVDDTRDTILNEL
jgi:hypothetical protein